MIPKNLSAAEIRDKAELFRKKYVTPISTVPVEIINIVEHELKLTIDPIQGLRSNLGIEAFLQKDLSTITIDKTLYYNPKFENRLRFTFAHEVGHIVLHSDEINSVMFKTEEDMIKFRQGLHEGSNYRFDVEASEFAGRLLVPKKELIKELKNNQSKIDKYYSYTENHNDDKLKRALSKTICSKFKVSDQVIYRRINSEIIWKELFE